MEGRHWPGDLWFAFANGGATRPRPRSASHASASKKACKSDVHPNRNWSAHRARWPPAAPASFPPPKNHTRYLVFDRRLHRVAADLANWTTWLNHHYANRDKRLRAAAPLLACTARRARAIGAPDARVAAARSHYASFLLDAAADARRADASSLQDDLTAAHLWAGRAHYRAAVQDQDPANA